MAEQIAVRTKPCLKCGESSTVMVEAAALSAWRKGKLIQDAFPLMDKGQRELLQTGTHPECWKILFKDEDEL
jgi:hypothetical protein